ncbi:hypothetical protein TNCV_3939601 [Trichonephila clavipes]|uniref:Uncharacterized protein n=1 Tax=Trichonephila clavipes TaxID=2585209 RepID=A0A8X6VVJ6_TRICX|nr:hypothetical protein TNCV_3939601 [Trichonephila clavipes]
MSLNSLDKPLSRTLQFLIGKNTDLHPAPSILGQTTIGSSGTKTCMGSVAVHRKPYGDFINRPTLRIKSTAPLPYNSRNSLPYIDEAHFWLNDYVNKQNCRIWSEANPQVYVETPLYPEKLTVWCALWAGGILLQKR